MLLQNQRIRKKLRTKLSAKIRLFNELRCTECRYPVLADRPLHSYMLADSVWAFIHPEGSIGFLCWKCLHPRATKYLDRPLSQMDFTVCAAFVNRHVLGLTAVEAFMKRNKIASIEKLAPGVVAEFEAMEQRERHAARSRNIDVYKLLATSDG